MSETSAYRLLKARDLIASPAFIVIKAANEFKDKTTAPNHLRYHESTANLTPADVYFGRGQTILLERERIKPQTIRQPTLAPVLPAEIEVRLLSSGLAESQAQGLKLTVEGLARLRSGR